MNFGTCTWCGHELRPIFHPRPGPNPGMMIRCDCEGATHAMRAMADPSGQLWPDSRRWFLMRATP